MQLAAFLYATILAIYLLLPPQTLTLNICGYAEEQPQQTAASVNGILRYSHDQLLQLREQYYYGDGISLFRGRRTSGRSGVRRRVHARGSRPPLPTLILANAQSLAKQFRASGCSEIPVRVQGKLFNVLY